MRRFLAALALASVVLALTPGIAEAKTSKFRIAGSARISGVTSVGNTLSLAVPGFRPEPTKVIYKWTRSGVTLRGATGDSVVASLPGIYQARVTAKKRKYSARTVSSNAVYVTQRETIAIGSSHGCGLHADGQVECWGHNSDGQLGDGTTTSRATAAPVIGLPDPVVEVEALEFSTCALTVKGEVWCWGRDYRGVLGNGQAVDPDLYFWDAPIQTAPSRVVGLGGTVETLGGTCALLAGGTVQCWGDGESGQLGNGQSLSSATPVSVVGVAGATHVSSYDDTACAVTGGKVKCWGWGNFGELGNGKRGHSATPVTVSGISNAVQVQVGGEHVCTLLATSRVKCWGYNKLGSIGDKTRTNRTKPVHVAGLTKVSAIATDRGATCALTAAGAVRCWGLGYGPKVKTVTGLSKGATALFGGHCATKATGSIVCWSDNKYGRLGTDPAIALDDSDGPASQLRAPQPQRVFQP